MTRISFAVFFAAAGIVAAQGRGGRGGQNAQNAPAAATPAPAAGQTPRLPPPEEKSVVTHHKSMVGGQQISYTATAGNYVIKDDAGNPKASFFLRRLHQGRCARRVKRPLSFVYNGGPGSASSFTHMGLGPKHVVLSPDGHGLGPAPYEIEDNQDSFLDATDMVFIDAVSTGYSRPVPGESPRSFTAWCRTPPGSPISFINTSRARSAGSRPNF